MEETKKKRIEDNVNPAVYERAKEIWGEIHSPDSDAFHKLLIGADMGYEFAILRMQKELFKMTKYNNDNGNEEV